MSFINPTVQLKAANDTKILHNESIIDFISE